MAIKTAAFVAATALLGWISRGALLRPRSHGFWRFLAWEAIVALFLVQVERWFNDPWSWHQLVAWALLAASLVPVVWGTAVLRREGRPVAARPSEPGLLAFERTTRLVESGPYRYIRHPLYSSLLLLAWGMFFKRPSLTALALVTLATACLFLTALADEAECQRFFGVDYARYTERTHRFVPFIL